VQDLAKLIGQLPIGVWVASVPSGQVAYTNAAFQAILGMGAREASQIEDAPATYGIFDRTGNPYPVEDLPFSRVVRTSAPVVVDDLVIHRPDGARVNVRAFAHPVRAETGALSHVSVVFIDISPVWKRTVSWSSSVVSFGCSDIWDRMNRMRIEGGRAVVR